MMFTIYRIHLVISLLCLIITTAAYAQGQEYTPLAKTGSIPEEFLPGKLKSVSLSEISADTSARKKKIFADFRVENNFYIYRMLISGYVLYNTPVNKYIDAVADKLLENDIGLRGRLRFFVVQSSTVNAFTFSNGMIFINTGLIAHCGNEAQLASVISHEIAHYLKGHTFNIYQKRDRITKRSRRDSDDAIEVERQLLELNHFSREQETEADIVGFELFSKSAYAPAQALKVFDMLEYSDYPFDSIPLRKTFFESRFLHIPNKYFTDTVVKVKLTKEEENDSLHTHPSVGKRREKIGSLLAGVSNPGASLFLVSEKEFIEARRICRYELSRLYVLERDYINAIYNSYLLLQEYPEDPYLYSCIIKALYFIQINANELTLYQIVRNPKKVKGEVQKIHYMMKNMRKDELNALCLRMAWDTHASFPLNEDITFFTEEITRQFEKKVSRDISYFASVEEYNDTLIASFYGVTDSELNEQERKKNRGRRTNRIKQVERGTFAKYAMPDYIANAEFKETFNRIASSMSSDGEDPETSKSKRSGKSPMRNPREEETAQPKPGKALAGNHDMILIDMDYIKIDQRKSRPVRYEASTTKVNQLIRDIQFCANENNIKLVMMTPQSITEKDSVMFSDRDFFVLWFNERLANGNIDEIRATDHLRLKNMARKYNTRYVATVYNAGLIMPKPIGEDIFVGILTCLIFPPAIIFVAYDMATPQTASYLGFIIYDTETGKLIYNHDRFYASAAHRDLIKGELYSIFLKLSKKK